MQQRAGAESTETECPDQKVDKPVPRKRAKQTIIVSAFKICTERPKEPVDSARGRVHLFSSHDIERATDGHKEYNNKLPFSFGNKWYTMNNWCYIKKAYCSAFWKCVLHVLIKPKISSMLGKG